MNILSSLAAGCGIIMAAADVSIEHLYPAGIKAWTYCAHYYSDPQCLGVFTPLAVNRGVISYVLLLFILIFCVTISTSVFACRTVCRTAFQETTVVIYQITSNNVSDSTSNVPPDCTATVTSG
ncbi:Membrane-spanning 4-domains subfamily A member 4A-like, partial [Pristimantis euphronides]